MAYVGLRRVEVRWTLSTTGTIAGTKEDEMLMRVSIMLWLTCFAAVGMAQQKPVDQPEAAEAAVNAAAAEAIRRTALDYIEGWYEGNAERMERSLHPELAKRMVETSSKGKSRLNQMSAMTLVQRTRRGGGKDTPRERRQRDVTILDVFQNAASVKIVASEWVDYLQMAKVDGRWVIVNVLWELKPATQ